MTTHPPYLRAFLLPCSNIYLTLLQTTLSVPSHGGIIVASVGQEIPLPKLDVPVEESAATFSSESHGFDSRLGGKLQHY